MVFKTQKKQPQKKTKRNKLPSGTLVGTFQSLSVIPGVSRAAATIVGGLVNRT